VLEVTGRRFAPLRVRPFGRLLTTYTVNELGDSIGIVALAVLIYDRTQEVVPLAAFFMVAKFLPGLLAPALTARVDQLALRRILPAIYAVEAAVFAALALIASSDDFELAPVLILALADGTLAITGRGLTRSAVAALLQPADLLREGNALMNVGFAVASVGGAALAGLLIGTMSVSAALYVDAASFVVIALLLAATSGLPQVEVEPERFLQRFRNGLRYARENVPVRTLLVGQALAMVLFTLIIPIEVIYAKESLDTTSAGYGILLAAWGAGIVVGSVIYLRVKTRSAFVLVLGSTFAVGVAYLGLAAANTLTLACAISIVGGAGNGIQWIAVMTALQEQTPRSYQARITGMMESIGFAMPGVGYLFGAAIVALADPRAAYAIAGGGVVLLVAAVALFRGQVFPEPAGPDLAAGNGIGPSPLSLAEQPPATAAPTDR
jgi:MFS family permease